MDPERRLVDALAIRLAENQPDMTIF